MKYKICEQVGTKISRARMKQGLTQEELAERAKMHPSTLGRIERGEANPPLYTLFKLSQALRVHIRDFFY